MTNSIHKRHVSKIGLVQALLALFLFDFTTSQTMATAFAAAFESKQSPGEAAKILRTVLTWLECEECIDGELKAVIRLQNRAVPPLSTALRKGPSEASKEIYRRELESSYTILEYYHRSKPVNKLAMTRDEYVALYLKNYVRLYQIRSLTALSKIGGTTATAALEDAFQAPLPREIKIRVREALTNRKLQNTIVQ